MSVYQINKILYLLDMDEQFLARLKKDPENVIEDFDLTDEEKRALMNGDVARLYQWGVHSFILFSMMRHEVFGLNREIYAQRIRTVTEGNRSAP